MNVLRNFVIILIKATIWPFLPSGSTET